MLNVEGQVSCDLRCAAWMYLNLYVSKYQQAAKNLKLINV